MYKSLNAMRLVHFLWLVLRTNLQTQDLDRVLGEKRWQKEEKFGSPQDNRELSCFYQLTNSILSEQIGKEKCGTVSVRGEAVGRNAVPSHHK